MDTKNSSPSITDSALRMPAGFPEVPDEVIERFPQMRNWMDEVNNFWRKNVNAVDDFARSVLDVTHVAGVLTVDPNAGSMYVKTTRGPGAFADPDTPFYIDSKGRFSLSNKVTWNGSVFTIIGGVTVDWDTQVTNRPGELTDGRITTAINAAGLVVSGVKPGVVVSTGGNAGLYLGSDFLGYYNGSAWKTYMDNTGNFYLGGTSGKLQWNGTTLTIAGSITLENTISYTSVSGLGALATQSSVAYGDITGTKPPSNADVTLSAIQGSLSLAGGGLVLASGGASIRGGQTAYDTGSGFWLGDVTGTTKFSIGNSAGDKLTWDGTALTVLSDAVYVGMEKETSGVGTLSQFRGPIELFDFGGGGFGSANIFCRMSNGTQAAKTAAAAGSNFGMNGRAWDGSAWEDFGRLSFTLSNAANVNRASEFALYVKDSSNVNHYITFIAGTLTATLFSGSGASLTALNAANLSSGTVPTARLGSGTANSSSYLRGDQTWASIAGGGDMLKSENLSGLSNYTTARSNLGLVASATTDTTNASNISSGTLADARLPADINKNLVIHPDTGGHGSIGCGEDAGVDTAFTTYLKIYANGATRYVPFSATLPT